MDRLQLFLGGFGASLLLHFVFTAVASRGSGPAALKPHLIAHIATTFTIFVTLANYGTYLWFVAYPADMDRTAGYDARAEWLLGLMSGFQLYEFCVCLFPNCWELAGKNKEFLGHHFAAGTLAFSALQYGYMHYYGAFFMGVSELSSMPLAFVDMFKQFPHLMKEYPAFADHVRTTFGVLFLIVRVVLWFPATYSFWQDSLAVWGAGGPAPLWLVAWFCICNLFLSFLQLFWATLILKAMYKKATGQEDLKKEYRN